MAEVFPILILAFADQLLVRFRTTFVLYHLFAIEIVGYCVVWLYDEPSLVPLAYFALRTVGFVGRDKVIQ